MTDRPRFYVLAITGYSARGWPVTSYAVLDRAFAHREAASCHVSTARGFYEMAQRRLAHALAERLNDGG